MILNKFDTFPTGNMFNMYAHSFIYSFYLDKHVHAIIFFLKVCVLLLNLVSGITTRSMTSISVPAIIIMMIIIIIKNAAAADGDDDVYILHVIP